MPAMKWEYVEGNAHDEAVWFARWQLRLCDMVGLKFKSTLFLALWCEPDHIHFPGNASRQCVLVSMN